MALFTDHYLAEWLKEKRREAGYTQRQVSDQLGYTSPQFISNIERGMASPPIAVLVKLSELYSIDCETLIEKTSEAQKKALIAQVYKMRKDA